MSVRSMPFDVEVALAAKDAALKEASATIARQGEDLRALQKIVLGLRRDPMNRRWILDDQTAAFHNLDMRYFPSP